MNPRRLRLIGVGLTATACLFALWHAEHLAAEVKLFGKKAGKPVATPQSAVAEQAAQQVATDAISSQGTSTSSTDRQLTPTGKQIKLNYFSKTWGDVLHDIAQQSGRQLIMDKVPPGRFSRNDWSRYSLNDTLNILNRELEPKGFRILERGQFLDLVFLRDARSEYARPVVSSAEPTNDDAIKPVSVETANAAKPRTKSSASTTKTEASRGPNGST